MEVFDFCLDRLECRTLIMSTGWKANRLEFIFFGEIKDVGRFNGDAESRCKVFQDLGDLGSKQGVVFEWIESPNDFFMWGGHRRMADPFYLEC